MGPGQKSTRTQGHTAAGGVEPQGHRDTTTWVHGTTQMETGTQSNGDTGLQGDRATGTQDLLEQPIN